MLDRPVPVAPRISRDPLGEALFPVRMQGVFYSHTDAGAPWGLEIPPYPDCLAFHVVAEGCGWLEVDREPSVQLRAGDMALVPHGRGHWLRSAPGAPATGRVDELPQRMFGERYSILHCGGDGPRTVMICGVVSFEQPAVGRLLDVLPPVLYRPGGEDDSHVRDILRLMAAELRHMRPGGEAVTVRLADVLVIEAIRAWLAEAPAARTGWLGALRDPQLGRAITAIHREPGTPWTVALLAPEAAMSRSAFAARFTELVGEPAMHYVARCRMDSARAQLARGDTIAAVAASMGYQSEAAFSRAFTRMAGTTPGAIRRAGSRPPQANSATTS
ncbi:AraC family transcriptional regulator [Nocardia crassostreae]|uniref:AraC family transcriptional regulator n=1 Tax=Nocardia crassostreae TaxID=53428 RepID=UPI001FE019A1|nr:AraC family transcriptional regulator [Nocardia crassostreae]